jgi:hypothetical protein
MKKLKTNFVDLRTNYDKTDNYLYNLLKSNFDLVIDKNYDLLFHFILVLERTVLNVNGPEYFIQERIACLIVANNNKPIAIR